MIQLFYIMDCQDKVFLNDETEFCFSQTLDELMECLNPSIFFRYNSQYLISREAIKDIDLWFNSRLSINLYYSGIKEKILVSKARVAEFKEWFSKRKRWFRGFAFLEQIAKQSVSCRETIGFNAWNFYLHTSLCLYAGMFISNGDRWRLGDRWRTTYHHPEISMNKAFQKDGDRLKEDFHFYVWRVRTCAVIQWQLQSHRF